MLKAADVPECRYSFPTGSDTYHFMNTETYEQYSLTTEDIEDQVEYSVMAWKVSSCC